MKRTIAGIALFLTGCGGVGYQGMSAEQIQAIGKIKDASINCVKTPTPWGWATVQFVNLDKGVLPNGGVVTSDQECKVTITNNPPPVKP